MPPIPSPAPPSAELGASLDAAYRLLCIELMAARGRWEPASAARARLDHALLDLTHHASQALMALGDAPDTAPLDEEIQRVLLREAFVSAINLFAITLALADEPGAPVDALARVRDATTALLEAFRPSLGPTDDDLRAVLVDGAPVREVLAARAQR